MYESRPRGSKKNTIVELRHPNRDRRNHGSSFPYGGTCGPSGKPFDPEFARALDGLTVDYASG